MKFLLRLSILLLPFFCFSQDAFEMGFYIDNQGKQVKGYINNENWFNNPDAFLFKTNLNSEVEKIDLETVKLFEIGQKFKYEKFTVQIDTKPIFNFKENNNFNAEPLYETKTVFLKVLVDGDASLLKYVYAGNSYFYYSRKDFPKVLPLVYKIYLDSDGRQRENTDFRKMLFTNVRCKEANINEFLNVKYNDKELVHIFETYNECKNATFKSYNGEDNKSKLNLIAFVGYGFTSYKSEASKGYSNENYTNPIFGAEFSVVLPHNNYRYEIFSRLYFDKINVENSFSREVAGFSTTNVLVESIISDFNAVNIILGGRYNFFMNENNNKLFLDAGFGINFISGKITYAQVLKSNSGEILKEDYKDLVTKNALLLNLGVGYAFNKRFALDLRYDIFYSGNVAIPSFYLDKNNKNSLTTSVRYNFL